MVDYMLQVLKDEYKLDYYGNKKMLARLVRQANKVKVMLAGNGVHEECFQIDGLFDEEDFEYPVTRSTFEAVCEGVFERAMDIIRGALEDSGLRKSDLANVTLVGGANRVPRVQENLMNFVDRDTAINMSLNPEEAVATGASIFGYKMDIGDCLTEGVDFQCEDSFGVSTYDEVEGKLAFDAVIPKITEHDYAVSRVYRTRKANQTRIRIRIQRRYKASEGEDPEYKLEKLADIWVSNLQEGPKGQEGARVIFYVDQDGRVAVSACDARNEAKNYY